MHVPLPSFIHSFVGMPFGYHTLLLSLKGGLFAFGCNDKGQLGLGHTSNQLQPAEIPWNGPQPVQADCGYEQSLVLDAEGGVWEAGGCSQSSYTFHRIPDLPCVALMASGNTHSAAIDTGLWVWARKEDLSWASS